MMKDELPDGWATTPVSAVCLSIADGDHQAPPQVDSGVPFITISAIADGKLRLDKATRQVSEEYYEQLKDERRARQGDILFSVTGSIGKVAYVDHEERFVFQRHIAVLRPDKTKTFGHYLQYALQTPNVQKQAQSVATGTAQLTIPLGGLRELILPIAPLAEQKRIADKLEAVLGRVDACRARLDRVPDLLKRFRQSVLAAATSGQLTEDWREKHPRQRNADSLAALIRKSHAYAGGHKAGNAAPPSEDIHDLTTDIFPNGWQVLTLREAVAPDRPITYGILMPGPEIKKGVPYVRVADFPNDRLNLTTIRNTSLAMDERFKRSRLRTGDLLMSIRGTVGRMVVVPPELEAANITQDTARLSIQPEISSTFVLWYLRSPMAQSRMRAATKGVAVRGMNIGDIRALQLPLPSFDEQQEIVRRVEALFAFADRIEARLTAARAQVERLPRATLSKAFRGDLVPQDPNDEPASKLLERVASNYAAGSIFKKRRKS